MKFYQFAYKNLLRSRTRTILTTLSIAVTTLILFVVFSLDKGFKGAVKDELVDGMGAHLFLTRGGCPMDAASIIAQGGVSPIFMPEASVAKLKGIPGIKEIMPFDIYAITAPDGSRTDIFCGITDAVERMKTKWKYKEGGWFKDENSVILGASIAAVEKRNVGEKIYIEHFDKELIVSGILEYSYNQDDGFFFLPLKTAQKLINREGKLAAVSITVTDINKLYEIKSAIRAKYPDDYMVLTPEAIGNDVMNFFNNTKAIMYAVLFFTLIISTVGIANTMIMMVHERRKELAYLKCVGAGFKDIYKLILQETFIICSIGITLGLTGGILSANLFEKIAKKYVLTSFISKTAHIIRPSVDIALLSVLIVVVTGLIAVSYPSIKTNNIMPMEAIRNE